MQVLHFSSGSAQFTTECLCVAYIWESQKVVWQQQAAMENENIPLSFGNCDEGYWLNYLNSTLNYQQHINLSPDNMTEDLDVSLN